MRIVAVSDIHCRWKKLEIPSCDILISAGDYSFRGEKHVVEDYHTWLNKQDAGYIVSVQGNHELWVEKNFEEARDIAEKACPGVYFIQQEAFDIEGIKFFGSAWTPWFYNWAWNAGRGADIKRRWDLIPEDTRILVTHGPPHKILDMVYQADGITPRDRVGCEELAARILELKKLKLHIFGHIHCESGEKIQDGVHYVNASICDEMYMPTNPVRVIDYE